MAGSEIQFLGTGTAFNQDGRGCQRFGQVDGDRFFDNGRGQLRQHLIDNGVLVHSRADAIKPGQARFEARFHSGDSLSHQGPRVSAGNGGFDVSGHERGASRQENKKDWERSKRQAPAQ